MDNHLISIIIPAYNAELYISHSLESCLEQTYSNIEIIVINDGSDDNTENIVNDYVSNYSNIKLISIENSGVSTARNIGINSSSGEYLMFLDADDILCPWAVEHLLDIILIEKADIAIGESISTTNLLDNISKNESIQTTVWNGTEALQKSLADHPLTYSVWAKLYRKEKITDVFFDAKYRIHEDSLFFFMCCTKEPKVIITNEVVHQYYASPDSASRSKFSEKKLDILLVSTEKGNIIQKLYPQFNHMLYNLMIKSKMALLNTLLSSSGYNHIEKECINYIIKYKKYFVPATSFDKKWFFIITHHLYYIFKWYKSKKTVKLNVK